MDDQLQTREYRCPLCESLLNREKWTKITGQWEESKKQLEDQKKLAEKYQKDKIELEKRAAIDKKRAAREAEARGIVKGIQKEKGQTIRMTKMIQKQAGDLDNAHKTIKQLQQQLKEGKTPQTAGFDYEKEVLRILSETFPEDNIKSTGKMGDVLQQVMINEDLVGKILYECKKTDKYSSEFIKEIIRHQELAKADYAVIVTHAQKKDKSKFFLEGNVIVIDPLGLLDLAIFLRISLIDMYKMKLTKEEVKQKGIEILKYMQAGEFKSYMVGNIAQTRKAYDLLIKEINNHKKDWEERIKIYYTIHQNTQNVRKAIGEILTGKKIGDTELETFPVMSDQDIPLLETGKIVKGN
ncbi:MAG: hypothetical protein A2171_01140 [Candidatus Levybacteria bacterium RBG_13_35_9]|nr:MAG: hypothetical protein A2171_01140 [Candidatus Levybacteria bacterium RBG_13_35_9]